jgi:hypothetical protein
MLKMAAEEETEPCHDPAVVETDRAHADDPAFDELEALVRRFVGVSFEFLGCDQAGDVGHF